MEGIFKRREKEVEKMNKIKCEFCGSDRCDCLGKIKDNTHKKDGCTVYHCFQCSKDFFVEVE